MPTTVGLPFSAHSTSIQVNPATAVANLVTSNALPASSPRRNGGTGVETEPAAPEQRGADEGEDHVMRGSGVDALAEHDRAHQSRDARVDMHHRAAGEIEHLH